MSYDDYRRDRQIEAVDAMVTAGMQAQADAAHGFAAQLAALVARDRQYGRDLLELRAIVDVLRDLIVEAGIDESVVRYRIEAAVDAAHAEADARERTAEMVECDGCQRTVPKERTNITPTGTLCDRCA